MPPAVDDVETRIRTFRDDLSVRPTPDMVRRHITFGSCFALNDNQYHRLKVAIADELAIHPSQICVVGSAKLGFSIAPSKRFRAFGDQSDIDVAIVSAGIFDQIWHEVFAYHNRGGDWEGRDWFLQYLFRGWIRIDNLPRTLKLPAGTDVWALCQRLTESREFGPYAIKAGLYRDWIFLEQYQSAGIDGARAESEGQA